MWRDQWAAVVDNVFAIRFERVRRVVQLDMKENL